MGINFTSIVIGSDMLVHRFKYSLTAAGTFNSLPYLLTAIMMPILGQVIDSVGKRMYFILFMGFTILFCHIVFILMNDEQCNMCYISLVPVVMYGFCIAVHACVMWSLVMFLAPPETLGTAFGIMACFQNFGMTIFPPIMSQIHDHTKKKSHGYYWVEAIFICLSIISYILSFAVYHMDNKYRDGPVQDVNPTF